jgi:hypothetical protein
MPYRSGRIIDTSTLRVFLVLQVSSDDQEREQVRQELWAKVGDGMKG